MELAQLGVEKSVPSFSPAAAARRFDSNPFPSLQIDIRLARQRRSSLATDKNIAARRARASARQSIRRNLPPLGQQAALVEKRERRLAEVEKHSVFDRSPDDCGPTFRIVGQRITQESIF